MEIELLSSTFVALRTQGINADPLRHACMDHLDSVDQVDLQARERFWREFILARRAYRKATGEDLERILARV